MIINVKSFYDQRIDSDIKRYEEIRKLTTGQGEDYTTGCLWDYDYIRNHYSLIAVDLSRQKELDADPKVIQPIEFVGQLKKLDDNDNATDEGNDQSMFILTILEKKKEIRLKFSQGNVTASQKMGNYQETRVQVINTQLKKLKSAGKKEGTILGLNKKNDEDEELQHEFISNKTKKEIKKCLC